MGADGVVVWLHSPAEQHSTIEAFQQASSGKATSGTRQCRGAEISDCARAISRLFAYKANSDSPTIAISGNVSDSEADDVQDCLYAPLLRHGERWARWP
jgi:hypothetical protein